MIAGDDEVACNEGDDFLEQHEDAVQSYIPGKIFYHSNNIFLN